MPSLTERDEKMLSTSLSSLFAREGRAVIIPEKTEAVAAFAQAILEAGTEGHWRETSPEIVGADPQHLTMMLVRQRRQLVYSIKPSNFLRDPFLSSSAASIAIFALYYTHASVDKLPLTFPGFLIGLAFTVLRSIAHPVGYGEAALLHLMNQIQERQVIVNISDLEGAGRILVEQYDYAKGNNSNEIDSLLKSLCAWNAIEALDTGYYVKESIPYGLGPLVYVE